uniref:Uncharacterized protein n=1 Tax=Pinguiococcus pyrenoidosus TaxID=172671 RepID=A0A7R9U7T9_9STRA|mmetsp:Transcript_17611/g.66997  ORF Transcript_17611/g.66997 Transcript_17611/m.66997 type:complete len:869 (+) Transcript_17611:213-2819(+)
MDTAQSLARRLVSEFPVAEWTGALLEAIHLGAVPTNLHWWETPSLSQHVDDISQADPIFQLLRLSCEDSFEDGSASADLESSLVLLYGCMRRGRLSPLASMIEHICSVVGPPASLKAFLFNCRLCQCKEKLGISNDSFTRERLSFARAPASLLSIAFDNLEFQRVNRAEARVCNVPTITVLLRKLPLGGGAFSGEEVENSCEAPSPAHRVRAAFASVRHARELPVWLRLEQGDLNAAFSPAACKLLDALQRVCAEGLAEAGLPLAAADDFSVRLAALNDFLSDEPTSSLARDDIFVDESIAASLSGEDGYTSAIKRGLEFYDLHQKESDFQAEHQLPMAASQLPLFAAMDGSPAIQIMRKMIAAEEETDWAERIWLISGLWHLQNALGRHLLEFFSRLMGILLVAAERRKAGQATHILSFSSPRHSKIFLRRFADALSLEIAAFFVSSEGGVKAFRDDPDPRRFLKWLQAAPRGSFLEEVVAFLSFHAVMDSLGEAMKSQEDTTSTWLVVAHLFYSLGGHIYARIATFMATQLSTATSLERKAAQHFSFCSAANGGAIAIDDKVEKINKLLKRANKIRPSLKQIQRRSRTLSATNEEKDRFFFDKAYQEDGGNVEDREESSDAAFGVVLDRLTIEVRKVLRHEVDWLATDYSGPDWRAGCAIHSATEMLRDLRDPIWSKKPSARSHLQVKTNVVIDRTLLLEDRSLTKHLIAEKLEAYYECAGVPHSARHTAMEFVYGERRQAKREEMVDALVHCRICTSQHDMSPAEVEDAGDCDRTMEDLDFSFLPALEEIADSFRAPFPVELDSDSTQHEDLKNTIFGDLKFVDQEDPSCWRRNNEALRVKACKLSAQAAKDWQRLEKMLNGGCL